MGFFYFDESIHNRGNFILGAFVYSVSDLSPIVYDKIRDVGLKPGIDEFKSSHIMKDGSKFPKLREALRAMFTKVNIGMVIAPTEERNCLGDHALSGLEKILISNNLNQKPHDVFFDQEIAFRLGSRGIDDFCHKFIIKIHLNQDSRIVAGLQVADLAAHTLSVMLLETLGLVNKKVIISGDPIYENILLELGFELWAGLRYSLFSQTQITIEAIERDPINAFLIDTGSYCLYVAPNCPKEIKEAADKRFGMNYVGCIH